jgi:hypothetical protein
LGVQKILVAFASRVQFGGNEFLGTNDGGHGILYFSNNL